MTLLGHLWPCLAELAGPEVIQTITPYIDREDFDPAAIKKVPVVSAGLAFIIRSFLIGVSTGISPPFLDVDFHGKIPWK